MSGRLHDNSVYLGFGRHLLDSYECYLAGIEETYVYYGLDFDRASIHKAISCHSVQKFGKSSV